jgi:methylmalonyl-CoA mutase N-terminal domain/subunit
MRFHTQTAGSTLTAQQPLNNVVRTTIQALAAVLGGTQSLHTNAYDEAVGLPTDESALLALRTQQVVAHESGVANTVDPLAGSYFVEQLTNELETKAEELLSTIASMGGAVTAIEEGWMQSQIEDSAYRDARRQNDGESVLVGVNRFTANEDEPLPVLEVDQALEAGQKEAVATWRENRDQGAVETALEIVGSTATTTQNLMPVIKVALLSGATVGEVSDALGRVFGRYRPTS